MDRLTRSQRSKVMSAIRGRNTRPEVLVRKELHSLGYRYRVHFRVLPGLMWPDIVFPSRKKVILVHGCFWHAHEGCHYSRVPDDAFWQKKLEANRNRDRKTENALASAGWKVLVIWECELADLDVLRERLLSFLDGIKP